MSFLPSLILILRRRRLVMTQGATAMIAVAALAYALTHAQGLSLVAAVAAFGLGAALYVFVVKRGDRAATSGFGMEDTGWLIGTTLAMEAASALYLVGVRGFTTPAAAVLVIPVAFVAVRGTGLDAAMAALTSVLIAGAGAYAAGAGLEGLVSAGLLGAIGLILGLAGSASRRAALDFSALYETGRALSSSLRQEDLLPLLLDIAMTDLDADIGMVFLIDRETQAYELASARGVPMGYAPAQDDIARSMCAWAVEHRGPALHSSGLEGDPVVRSLGGGVREAIAVPLISGRGPVGVILAAARHHRGFTGENARFLEALASQAATSVENAMLYRQTAYWAIRDGLTGLYNYRHFAERLEIELARGQRYQKPLSLLIVDIDLFKAVNDRYGHLVGDEVLRSLAMRLAHGTRETDLVARYGGEEFAIVLPETKYEDAMAVAEKLRVAIRANPVAHVGPDQEPVSVTVSIGVATYPKTVVAERIVSQADEALYDAKSHRDCVRSIRGKAQKVGAAPPDS